MRPDDTKSPTPLDPCVLEQAAEWVVRLGEHGGAQDQAACERWQQQHPDNARAWRRVEELLGTINAVPPAIARPVLDRPKHPGRRLAMKHLGAWLLAAPAGWLAWQLWEQSNWDQRFTTGTGEWQNQHQQLADGTQIELDSGTSLDVAYGAKQRLLRLQQGQVLIRTAPDTMPSPRPFRVATTHGYMQALGTRFNVRVRECRTHLAVFDGAVRIELGGKTRSSCRVDAGFAVWFDRDRCVIAPKPTEQLTGWSKGLLVINAEPLGQVLEELGRYRHGVLRCDPSVARLLVSGVFPLADIDQSLDMIAQTHGLAIERRANGWWTTVVPK